MHVYISSSSCRTASTDLPDPLSPSVSIVYRFWKVFQAISYSGTEVLAGPPAFARPCEGVHRSILLMSSSLLLQQSPACLVHLTWIVFVMGGRWLFCGVLLPGLVQIAHSILVYLPSSFFSLHLVSVHVVHPYSSIDTTIAWKKLHFILLVRSNFCMTNRLLIAVHAFASHVLMAFSVDETLLLR